MKKLLLGLSVLAALALSLQATANPQQLRNLKNAKNGKNAATAGRSTITTTNRAAQVERGSETAVKAAEAGSMESMMRENGAGIQRVENNEQCNRARFGGVDTETAFAMNMLPPASCNTELSASSKRKQGLSIEPAADYLAGKGYESIEAAEGTSHYDEARAIYFAGLEEHIDGERNGGPVRYNDVVTEIAPGLKGCNLNVFN